MKKRGTPGQRHLSGNGPWVMSGPGLLRGHLPLGAPTVYHQTPHSGSQHTVFHNFGSSLFSKKQVIVHDTRKGGRLSNRSQVLIEYQEP